MRLSIEAPEEPMLEEQVPRLHRPAHKRSAYMAAGFYNRSLVRQDCAVCGAKNIAHYQGIPVALHRRGLAHKRALAERLPGSA